MEEEEEERAKVKKENAKEEEEKEVGKMENYADGKMEDEEGEKRKK